MPQDAKSLLVLINDAARLTRSEFGRSARDHKLTLLQWRTLGVLARGEAMTQSAIAARIEASPMTMSDIVNRLESLGYVDRQTDPADSRAKRVHLAPAALPIVEDMRAIAQSLTARALAGFSDAERDQLAALLARVMANLDTPSPDHG
ncbi:MAG: MarR family transcriptional regulator [Rhodobacteraceae bacterium]|nr:MarR family transcriptional regulator [Paracoccaceae bacterium]